MIYGLIRFMRGTLLVPLSLHHMTQKKNPHIIKLYGANLKAQREGGCETWILVGLYFKINCKSVP